MDERIERDALGEARVPADPYYGALDPEVANAIARAAREVADGSFDDHGPGDVGAGVGERQRVEIVGHAERTSPGIAMANFAGRPRACRSSRAA
ncbi:MAG: hypothetical protein ACRDHS_12965 [Actinomycetota bacterium]